MRFALGLFRILAYPYPGTKRLRWALSPVKRPKWGKTMRHEDRRELAVKAVNRLEQRTGRIDCGLRSRDCFGSTPDLEMTDYSRLSSSISRLALLHFTYERLIFRVACKV